MKYLLFFSVFAISSYSALAQSDGIYYLQKKLNTKTTKKWNYFENYKEEVPLVPPTNKTIALANSNTVSFLKQDNMPCIKPDMSQFNMPCVKPEEQTYHMPVLRGDETSKVYIFKDGKFVAQKKQLIKIE